MAGILPGLSAPRHIALSAAGGPRLAGLLWEAPAGAPGVLVIPGLGSRKENHADLAGAVAGAGMAALALDLRGHGESTGEIGAGVLDDALAGLAELAARGHSALGVRGSSMGGLLALNAALRDARVGAVVAICPARPEGLARGLGARWPLALALEDAVRERDGVARAYWHATGDDRVPWGSTLALAGLTPHPMRLRIALGGGHATLQHDPGVLAESVAFLSGHLGAGR